MVAEALKINEIIQGEENESRKNLLRKAVVKVQAKKDVSVTEMG